MRMLQRENASISYLSTFSLKHSLHTNSFQRLTINLMKFGVGTSTNQSIIKIGSEDLRWLKLNKREYN